MFREAGRRVGLRPGLCSSDRETCARTGCVTACQRLIRRGGKSTCIGQKQIWFLLRMLGGETGAAGFIRTPRVRPLAMGGLLVPAARRGALQTSCLLARRCTIETVDRPPGTADLPPAIPACPRRPCPVRRRRPGPATQAAPGNPATVKAYGVLPLRQWRSGQRDHHHVVVSARSAGRSWRRRPPMPALEPPPVVMHPGRGFSYLPFCGTVCSARFVPLRCLRTGLMLDLSCGVSCRTSTPPATWARRSI